MRAYWKGSDGVLGEFARRLTGSSDLFEHDGRRPYASVNFVTAHDGFTLRDLVSYNEKHNEANGEDNRDGSNHNISWNCGAEGPAEDPDIAALRERQKRNLLATLLLSQGVPMLLAGDERGHTQNGNNNAYCQDNDISWLDWTPTPERQALITFVERTIALRRAHPSFRRRSFFAGKPSEAESVTDVVWLRPDGAEMRPEDWSDANARCLAMYMSGGGIADRGPRGEALHDDDFLVLFNAHHDEIPFTLPPAPYGAWRLLLDTASGSPPPATEDVAALAPAWSEPAYPLQCRSLVVLSRPDVRP
jgi:glycogen operon protein